MAYLTANGQLLIAGTNPIYITYYEPESVSLFNRMSSAFEEPTFERKNAINTAIVSLKANDLFTNQFDVFVVTRGHGPESTKMNWIKNSENAIAVSSPTYTQNVGYNSPGYLNTKFVPVVNGIKYTKDDGCFGYKVSGAVSQGGNQYHGGGDAAGTNATTGGQIWNINTTYNTHGGMVINASVGYNCATRDSSTFETILINNYSQTFNILNDQLANTEMFILAWNLISNNPFYTVSPTEVIEVYWFGKSISQSKFLTLQSIMNTYFSSF